MITFVVGGSGSGKSTFLNLLMASNNDYKGSITIDGKEKTAIKLIVENK